MLLGAGLLAGAAGCGGDSGNSGQPLGAPSSLSASLRPVVERGLAQANGPVPGKLRAADSGTPGRPELTAYRTEVLQFAMLCTVPDDQVQALAQQAKASWKQPSLLAALKEIELRVSAGVSCTDAAAGS